MRKRTNPDSELNIKRIDHVKKRPGTGSTHGFQVYFCRERVEYTRFFADTLNGGKESARLAARTFRDVLEASIPAAKTGPSRTGKSRSNSGSMGISISLRPLANGGSTLVIQASARIEKGVPKHRTITVGDNSLEDSIQQAFEWRAGVLNERLKRETEQNNLDAEDGT